MLVKVIYGLVMVFGIPILKKAEPIRCFFYCAYCFEQFGLVHIMCYSLILILFFTCYYIVTILIISTWFNTDDFVPCRNKFTGLVKLICRFSGLGILVCKLTPCSATLHFFVWGGKSIGWSIHDYSVTHQSKQQIFEKFHWHAL